MATYRRVHGDGALAISQLQLGGVLIALKKVAVRQPLEAPLLSDAAACRISASVKPLLLPFYRLVFDVTELVVCPPTVIGLVASTRLSGVCADLGQCDKSRTHVGLLDDLVGARQQRLWYS